ncbi:MAG: hypothetical protein D6812_12655 [Deltaproteobacteria bacterium]|nr:MAG: hypothetical protein D6812_12655 [Deltaproteobacteria bacterium]
MPDAPTLEPAFLPKGCDRPPGARSMMEHRSGKGGWKSRRDSPHHSGTPRPKSAGRPNPGEDHLRNQTGEHR